MILTQRIAVKTPRQSIFVVKFVGKCVGESNINKNGVKQKHLKIRQLSDLNFLYQPTP